MGTMSTGRAMCRACYEEMGADEHRSGDPRDAIEKTAGTHPEAPEAEQKVRI